MNTLEKKWDVSNFDWRAVFQPDGKKIISEDVLLRSWDAKTGKFLDTLFDGGSASLYAMFLRNKAQTLIGTSFLWATRIFAVKLVYIIPLKKTWMFL